jgi:hypothetical protein
MFNNWGPLNPLLLLQRLNKNPLVLFIYSILAKWYLIIIASSLIVTYYVLDGLKQAGVLAEVQNLLVKSIDETKAVAKNCLPRIRNLKEFWRCLNDPANARYVPSPYDQELKKALKNSSSDKLNKNK